MTSTPEGYIGGDPGYHRRHERRTLGRAKAISETLARTVGSGRVQSLLDAGCNKGLTSKYLLDTGMFERVTGIELAASTVMDSLLTDSRFTLIEGNISSLQLTQQFDVVIYGAVHHHIFRNHGLRTSIEVLRRLAHHCNHHLFFETGHVTEGGRWRWQHAIRRYFRTDEEHVFYLLRSIESRMENFEIIGKFWIHGIRRWLIRIDLRQSAGEAFLSGDCNRHPSGERYIRTYGRHDQKLILTHCDTHDSPTEFTFTKENGERLVTKSYLHHTTNPMREYAIGNEIKHRWAVKARTLGADGTLTFPYVEGTSINDSKKTSFAERSVITSQLRRIWKEAKRTRLSAHDAVLIPINPGTTLLEVVDMNVNNFIIERVDGAPVVRVIDFEPHSNHNLWRNRLHFARIMLALRQHRLWSIQMAFLGFLGGLLYCVTYQCRHVKTRIANRQPSLGSIVLAEARTLLGRFARTLPFLRET